MKDRVVKFRTSVGGFDRRDVMSYIKLLAQERNELRLLLDERKEQPRDACRHNSKEFESAEDVLRALEAKHEEIGKQINALRLRLESHTQRKDK